MEKSPARFKKYIFVCGNSRPPGDDPGKSLSRDGRESCGPRGGYDICDKLKAAVKERGLQGEIRVSKTGCLDVCAQGPNVLVYPDNVWYKKVSLKDIDQIIEEQITPS